MAVHTPFRNGIAQSAHKDHFKHYQIYSFFTSLRLFCRNKEFSISISIQS